MAFGIMQNYVLINSAFSLTDLLSITINDINTVVGR